MKVSEAIKARRTIRGFKKDRVPESLLEEIFELAQHSASNCNTQPWHTVVVSGDKRDKLENLMLTEIMSGGSPSPGFKPGDQELKGVYRERQIACASDYYGTMGISREDKDARNALMVQNWQFFGAPHAAFISMPKSMGEVNAIDIGIYLQSLMLLLTEYGLASCPQGALAFFPKSVYELCDIPEENAILVGLSFGYAEEGAKINTVKMPRAPLSESVSFES